MRRPTRRLRADSSGRRLARLWTVDPRAEVEHTVTASDNGFSSPAIQTDGQYSYTFTTPDTYSYFCAIHQFMTAKVIVQ